MLTRSARFSVRRAAALAVLALMPLAACDNSSGPSAPEEPLPLRLIPVSSTEHTGTAGKPLAEDIAIKVFDVSEQRAVPGVHLNLVVTGGTVEPAKPVTDREGVARARWTMPTAAGAEVTLLANFADPAVATEPVNDLSFRATPVADVPRAIVVAVGDGQAAPPEAELSPFVVRVSDQYGNPVEGVEVLWEAEGDAAVLLPKTTTQADGRASTRVVAGRDLGESTVSARADGVGEALFSFTVVPATTLVPATIEVFGGADQSIPVNTTAEPVGVRVLDAQGRPVPSVRVDWTIASGGGMLYAPWVYTDREGVATNLWTFGTKAGEQRLVAHINGHPASVDLVGTALPGAPTTLTAIRGGGQRDTVMRTLAEPYVLQVADQYGNTVPGVEVRWAVTSGQGSVSPSFTITDAAGLASVAHTLGPIAGPQAVNASVESVSASESFASTALAGRAAKILADAGDNQVGVPGDSLSQRLVAKVTDEWGNAVEGADVTWSVVAGGGALSASTAKSDTAGLSAVRYTVGGSIGTQQVRARIDAGASVTFDVRAVTPRLEIVSGDNQTAPVGSDLPQDLVVFVADAASGEPLVGVVVQWSATTGGGRVAETATLTDESGEARVARTLGPKAGEHTTTARVASASVEFTAMATGGSGEARIEIVSGDGQFGVGGKPLPNPFVVRVLDAQGAPASGVTVNWAVRSGGGSLQANTSTTDAQGRAQMLATLPSELGAVQRVVAKTAALADSAVFTSTVYSSGEPASIAVASGDNQVGTPGAQLAEPLSVRVTSANGEPVAGVAVHWAVVTGGGAVSQAMTTTNDFGIASVTRTLGFDLGSQSTSASVPGLQGSPVIFNHTAARNDVVPARLVIASGDGQGAQLGQVLVNPLVVQVLDEFGNAVPGVAVRWVITSGGGEMAPSPTGPFSTTYITVVSDASGMVRVWRKAPSIDRGPLVTQAEIDGFGAIVPVVFVAQYGEVTSPGSGSPPAFLPEALFTDAVRPEMAAQFASAIARWTQAITGDLPDQMVSLSAGECVADQPAYSGVVDDVLLIVTVDSIDGPGSILGLGGPCVVRSSGLPAVGRITLDEADVDGLLAQGSLWVVLEHEIGHALGIGTLTASMVEELNTAHAHFTGEHALREYLRAGGDAYSPAPVPMEEDGAHWRKSVFGGELMTPSTNGTSVMSAVTIGALRDIGYHVNLGAAGQYQINASISPFMAGATVTQGVDVDRRPPMVVDRSGRRR